MFLNEGELEEEEVLPKNKGKAKGKMTTQHTYEYTYTNMFL